MKKAEAHRRSESDTPWVAPQDPCDCGREDDGETWMKPEPERLNDPVRNPDVAHPGGEGNPAIHKQIKPQYAAVLTACGGALTPTRIGRAKQLVRDGKAKVVCHTPFVIVGGNDRMLRCEPVVLGQMRRNNRSLQTNNVKGLKGGRRIRRKRNPYHKGDLVWIDGKMNICGGMTGGRVVVGWKVSSKGTRYADSANIKKIEKVFYVRQYAVINK